MKISTLVSFLPLLAMSSVLATPAVPVTSDVALLPAAAIAEQPIIPLVPESESAEDESSRGDEYFWIGSGSTPTAMVQHPGRILTTTGTYGNINDRLIKSGDWLRVKLPAGQAGSTHSGISIYSTLSSGPVSAATVEYFVHFPSNFEWVIGGKLPGIYGGNPSTTECNGGSKSGTCFSVRLMWRANGVGEAYAYLPNASSQMDLCNSSSHCSNASNGFLSIGRGNWNFIRGTGYGYYTRMRVVLNTPGQRNGILEVHYNGAQVVFKDNVMFRTSSETGLRISNGFMSVAYGGSGDAAEPNNYNEVWLLGYKVWT